MGVLEVSRWTCFPSGRTDTQTSRGGFRVRPSPWCTEAVRAACPCGPFAGIGASWAVGSGPAVAPLSLRLFPGVCKCLPPWTSCEAHASSLCRVGLEKVTGFGLR